MRFRMCPYFVFLHACGIAVALIAIVVGGWFLLVGLPNSDNKEVGVIFIILGSLFLSETIKLMRTISFPWFSFSEAGVKKEWLLNVNVFIAWEECAEIGVMYAKLAGGRHHGPLPWIYFSKVPLTDEQRRAYKNGIFKPDEFIFVEYFPSVLDELLKYINCDSIQNLHLLKR